MRSFEQKLEGGPGYSLSLNYWLTKFIQEIANKNEIVNSAHGMFTELKKMNWQCSWLIAKRTKSKNIMRITEFPARLSQQKRVLKEKGEM